MEYAVKEMYVHTAVVASWNSGDAFGKPDAFFTKHFSYFIRESSLGKGVLSE